MDDEEKCTWIVMIGVFTVHLWIGCESVGCPCQHNYYVRMSFTILSWSIVWTVKNPASYGKYYFVQIVRFFNNLFVFKSSVEVNGKLCGNLRQAHHRSGSGDSFYSLPLFLFSFSLYNHNLSNSWLAWGSGHKPAIKAVIWNLSTIQTRNDNTYKTQVNTR